MRVVCLVLALLAALPGRAESVFKWRDEHGVTHYGDRVPVEAAKRERQVLNEQGIAVDTLSRELNAQERAAQRREAEERAKVEEAARRERERDRILLATYLTVQDIELLRDERLATLAGQLRVNDHYVKILRERLLRLEERARRFNYPYDENSELPALPASIAEDLLDTATALSQRETDMSRIREEQARIRMSFEADIARFRELKEQQTAEADPAKPL